MDTYLPFGSGGRICIGAGFAMVEAQIILASLLSRHRIVPEDKRPILPVFRLATVPDRDPWFRIDAV
jgi:cytochrome P450